MSCKKCKCKVCSCIKNEVPKIAVNGIVQNPNEEDVVNVKVPTKTSQLINDSGFGQGNGGGTGGQKIEDIRVNGELVPIINKEAIMNVPTKTSNLINDSNFVTKPYVDTHIVNRANPHNVTKEQVNLGNVDNTSDLNKPISTATQLALNTKLGTTDVKSEVVYEDLRPVNSVAIEKHSVKKINTIADLRNTVGEYEGQVVELLGYYEAGDKEPLNYKWINTQGVDDGGSVINSGSGSWIAQFLTCINVKDFGAKAIDGYDNSIHFKSLCTYIGLNPYKEVIVSDSGTYETSETLNFPINNDLLMFSYISFTNDNNSKGLVFGNEDFYNFHRKALIKVSRKTVSDWENPMNIGVEIWNLYESIDFNIQASKGFTTGIKFIGKAKGCVYNSFNIGVVTNSRYQIVLSNLDNGWTNENLFTINRLQNNSTTHITKSRFGIIIDSDDGKYNNNNNIFEKPSIELASKAGVECRAIKIKYGSNNRFENVRNEGNFNGSNGIKVYCVENSSTGNIINEGYGLLNPITELVDEMGDNSPTIGVGIRSEIRNPSKKPLIYDSGFIPNSISQYNATQYRTSKYLKFAFNTNSNISNLTDGVTLSPDYLQLSGSRAIAVTFDTNRCKKFFVHMSTFNNIFGRFNIRCYDINGDLLDNSVKNHVKSSQDSTYAYFDNQFKSWRTGANGESTYFQVSDEVFKIDLIISGAIQLTRFKVFGVDILTTPINCISETLIANIKPTITVSDNTIYYCNNSSLNMVGWIYLNNVWNDIPKLIKSNAVANVSSVDATDLASALTLVNELKAKLNAKLTADRNSGQQAIE